MAQKFARMIMRNFREASPEIRMEDDGDFGEMHPFFLYFIDKETERSFNSIRGEQLKSSYVMVQFVILLLGIGTVYQAFQLGYYYGVANYSFVTLVALSSMYLFYVKKSVFFLQYTRYAFSICFMIMMLDTCEYVILHEDSIVYDAVLSSAGIIYSYGLMGFPWIGCLIMGIVGSISVSIGTSRGHTVEGKGIWIFLIYASASLLAYSGERCWRKMFAALKKAEREKLGDQRMKYVANMSHDLRTPLNAFKLGLDMLSEACVSEAEHRNVTGVMQEALGIMCNTIDNLRLFASTTSCRTSLDGPVLEAIRPVPLFKLCRAICLSYASGLGRNSGQVDIELDLDPSLPTWIHTEADKLQQMVINLLTNARKFTSSRILLKVMVSPLTPLPNQSDPSNRTVSHREFLAPPVQEIHGENGLYATAAAATVSSENEVEQRASSVPSQEFQSVALLSNSKNNLQPGDAAAAEFIQHAGDAESGLRDVRSNVRSLQFPEYAQADQSEIREEASSHGSSSRGSVGQQSSEGYLQLKRAASIAVLEGKSSSGHPAASVSLLEPTQMMTVEVWDDGPGVTPLQKQRLFRPFEQLESDIGQGSGLGLYSVRLYSQAMGGQCGVRDNPLPSGGSIFFFQIPLLEAPPSLPTNSAPHQALPVHTAQAPPLHSTSLPSRLEDEKGKGQGLQEAQTLLSSEALHSHSPAHRKQDSLAQEMPPSMRQRKPSIDPSHSIPGPFTAGPGPDLLLGRTTSLPSRQNSKHSPSSCSPAGSFTAAISPPHLSLSSSNHAGAGEAAHTALELEGAPEAGTLQRRHSLASTADPLLFPLHLEVPAQVELDPLLSPGTLPAVTPDGRKSSSATSSSSSSSSPAGGTVLVADDVSLTQVLMKKMLSREGFAVDIAGNGLEALELMKARKYTLVLMDLMMPVMDGFECVRQYRAWEGTARPGFHQPICALSANAPAFQGTQERTREVGMDSFMAKPFRKQMLLEYLASLPPSALSAPKGLPSVGPAPNGRLSA